MMFGSPLKPRRFEFIPTRREKGKEPRQIEFRRLGYYDFHGATRIPARYIIMLILALGLFFYLRCPQRVMKPVEITVEDAAGK